MGLINFKAKNQREQANLPNLERFEGNLVKLAKFAQQI